MIIHTKSYPRAALIGNPSDGYFGKTIAFVFENFSAEIILYQTPELEILPHDRDHSRFKSIDHLVDDVRLYGYYGGIRLLKATVKKFHEYCQTHQIQLDDRNFTIRYSSTIPHQLGLAGSSAIITACMQALMSFYSIEIPKPVLANYVLAVEHEELQISAGLQDRVAQAYETPVYMDFHKETMQEQGYGNYSTLDAKLFPPLYIAYRTDLSEGSEVIHDNLRARYNNKDPEVLAAIDEWSDLSVKLRKKLESGKGHEIDKLINRNFNLRNSVCQISNENQRMVEIARDCGASSKFTGSGGAIIGTYRDETMFAALAKAFKKENIEIIKPVIVEKKS